MYIVKILKNQMKPKKFLYNAELSAQFNYHVYPAALFKLKKEFNDKKVYFLSFHEFVISAAIFSSATQFEVSKENSKLSNNGNYRI